MAQQPKWIKKSLVFKPEVHKILDDLDAWRDYCRINLIAFNEADLYRSSRYKEWQDYLARKAKREAKLRQAQYQPTTK